MKLYKRPNPGNSFLFSRTGKRTANRTVLAAMTNKQSYDNGIISQKEIDWLAERAKGGFGIITTAATNVSASGQGWTGQFGVYDDMHISSLKKLTTTIHKTNSLILAQLFHGGIRSPQKLTGVVPLSASELICNESATGKCRSASHKEINDIIDNFTEAAIRCSKSGFDGIELHGAHGYLISQFLGLKTNRREDNWGGDLEKRSQFLIKIYKSIKKNVPESFLIGIRISPEIDAIGINLHDTIKLVEILKKTDLDFIHLSCWDVFAKSNTMPNENRTLTEIITSSYTKLPAIISTGGVWSSEDAQKVLNQGANLVGVGRVAIAHPNWPNNIFNGDYNPSQPPFTAEYLKKMKLSEIFIDYMRNWHGFVK